MGDRADSTAWTSASMELVANTFRGRPSSSSGSSTAQSAYMVGATMPILVPMRVRFSTAMFVTSLPVPQVVGMITSSLALFSAGIRAYSSSMSMVSATANTLARSMMVPPPMAMMRSKVRPPMSFRMASAMTSLGSPKPYFS